MRDHKRPYKIMIVDDHQMFRKGIKLMLETEGIGLVTGEADNGQQFLDLLRLDKPDIVLMDIDMPVMDGLSATEKAFKQFTDIKIIGLSMFGDEKFYTRMLKAGARGFLLKKSGINDLKNAIHEVANGNYYFSNELLHKLVTSMNTSSNNKQTDSDTIFTERELEIIQLLSNGYSTNEIADTLLLSPKTIDTYRSKMIAKTNTKNTVDLVIFALRKGFISIG